MNGGGGGGSGGIAVSILKLDKSQTYNIAVTSEQSAFGTGLYATSGKDASGQTGGAGGNAYGGNVGNSGGYMGGNGSSSKYVSSDGGYADNGQNGGNSGMAGGKGGGSWGWDGLSQTVPGGGGGGARLPDIYCPYVISTLSNYQAGGGWGYSTDYHDNVTIYKAKAANSYPYPALSPSLKLYGGGGGASYGCEVETGWSEGTPGVVIIEQCTDTTPPTIESIEFSTNRKRVTITGSDEYGIAGYYINGTFAEGNPLTYEIPSGVTELAIRAEDNAGNLSVMQYVDVLPAAPGITVTPDKAWLNAADGKAVVTLSTDAVDIFEDVKLWYSLDGGAGWTYYSAPLEVSETCTVTAKVTCTNGDSEPAQKEIHIDSLPPTMVSAVVNESDMENRFLTVTAEDTGGSGVKGIWIDNVMWTDNPAVYYIPKGKDTVTLKVEDIAGNLSEQVEQVVRHIDTIPPTIDSVEFTDDLSVVTIRMSDDTYGDGVKGVYINGVFKAGNPILWAIPEDVVILRLQAEDNNGNKSEIRRERVPGRTAIVDTITIDSIIFSEDNTMATITASTSEPETSITGIYCNGELIEGNPVTYTIPIDNSQYLKVQAVNNEGDKSEIVTKRVPGWSEVTDSIAVTSVELLNENKLARVRADTTRLNATIMGIYVNSVFYEGNPIECAVASGTTYLECQAVDDTGDLSQPVIRPIPKETTTGSGGGSHHSSGSGSTTSISISEPIQQDDGLYRFGISAKDSECEIEKLVAAWDGHKDDITKSHFILLENNTLLQVIAVNSDGRMTYKKVRIQLAGDEPIEEEPVPETPAAAKTNPTARQESYAGQTAPAQGSSAGTESDNAQADPREQLEELLRRQQLKHKEQPTQAANIQQVIPEPIRRPSGSSNRPGAAAVLASVLCFLALMVLIVLLVRRQHKASAYCTPDISKKQ